jgi:dihydrofolate synthase/folylpolyglutamate synthase
VIGPSADLQPVREKAGARLIRSGDLELRRYPNLRPRLLGRHQRENIAVAIQAAECLGIPGEDIRRGVDTATWPGRLERMGPFLLDGAHNVAAANALAAFLGEFHPEGVWVIFAAMADKQFEQMIAILKPHARQFIFTRTQSPRAADPVQLQNLVAGSHVESTVGEAISYAREHAAAGSTILICGSLYMIGEARAMLE